MNGSALLQMRQAAGLSQTRAAELLEVSQSLLSQMEQDKRGVTAEVAVRAVEALGGSPSNLPLNALNRHSDDELAMELAALGYPGFSYLKGHLRNPAEVLIDALDRPDLGARVVEGLPWLPFRYPDMNWNWLIAEAKLRNRQNRLGFVVELAQQVAKQAQHFEVSEALDEVLRHLNDAKLAKEDTLCQESWPASQRALAHAKRSPLAKRWKLDTRMTEADLAHYA